VTIERALTIFDGHWPSRALTIFYTHAYHRTMITLHSLQERLGATGRSGAGWLASWWHVARMAAIIVVLALSPSTYHRANRAVLARYLVLGTLPILPWFALLSALLSVVLIRIVVITATSYNLSQYAMEMMIRVLVLELIPLTAALFVALRNTVPGGTDLVRMQARGELQKMQQAGIDPLREEVLPRVVAGIFAVLMLASVSCLIAMILAYVAVYGFSLSAFAGFTRTMGHIFNPAVALILAFKTLFFSLAVALIPMSAVFYARPVIGPPVNRELRSLLRLFATLLAIEIVSLLSNYY
jgi:phospholipid/cholesterol/gamma-HCH transport system permease protein